jgi:hypothetical protein
MARRLRKAWKNRAPFVRMVKLLLLPALVTLALAGAAGAYSLARVVEQVRPDVALAIMPSLPPALDARADQLMAGVADRDIPGRVAEARALAQRSLRASALNPSALRTLAAARQGSLTDGARLVELALQLSRRDLGAQLLQIEIDVARNDIPATLRHYDQVLRVAPSVGPTLYPILLSASDDRAILPFVRQLVSADPPWLGRLAGWTLENPDYLVKLTRLVPWIPPSSEAMSQDFGPPMIDALVRQNRFDAAFVDYLAYRRAMPFAPPDHRRPLRPFDWTSMDNFETGSDAVADRPDAFDIFAESGASGEVLSRLGRLAPGTYRLAFALTSVEGSGGAVQIAVSCAGGDNQTALLSNASPISPHGVAVDFNVPATGCPYQWVRLHVRAGQEGMHARLERLSLVRAG